MPKPHSNQLINCECCPRMCQVDRINGKPGYCKMGAETEVSHIGLHFGEEPPISGTRGSGTIFFPGCNLRCVFCQNYQISQKFKKSKIQKLTSRELAVKML